MIETEEVNRNKGCCACCVCFKRKKSASMESDDPSEPVSETTIERVSYDVGLEEKLVPGRLICVAGFVPSKCHRFSINLKCDVKDPNADIAFHFNPRLEQRYVVRNCRISGHWAIEDTSAIVKFPFHYRQKFSAHILVTESEFMVTVDEVHWCAFAFRLPLERVCAMDVRGNVEVHSVTFRNLLSYPEIKGNEVYPTIKLSNGEDGAPTQDLTIPFTGSLPKPLILGWEVVIAGRVKLLPHTFYINLQTGAQLWPHPTIPLHLNPRFCTKYGESVFVRNYWSDGSWGTEERATIFPFSPGGNFNLIVRKEAEHFSVWVDGQLTGEFPFKIPSEKISCVYVQGDVVVHKITMRESTQGMMLQK